MSAPQFPEDIFSKMAEYERRLVALERSVRVPTVSTIGTTGTQYRRTEGTSFTSAADVYTDLGGNSPSVQVEVGSGERILVQGGAYLSSSVDGQNVVMALYIDGSHIVDFAMISNSTGGTFGADVASTYMVVRYEPVAPATIGVLPSFLHPGLHTVSFRYRQSVGGASAGVSAPWMVVQGF